MDGGAIAIWATGLCILAVAFTFASPARRYCSAISLWRLQRARQAARKLAAADRVSCDRERLYVLPRVQSGRLELHFGANAAGWAPGVITAEACTRSLRDAIARRSWILLAIAMALSLAWAALIALDPGAGANLSLFLKRSAAASIGGQVFAALLLLSTLALALAFWPFEFRTPAALDGARGELANRGPISWVSLATWARPARERAPHVADFAGSDETLSDIDRFAPLQRAALGANHESVFAACYYRSATLFHLERYVEALSDIVAYAEPQRRALGSRNPWVLKVQYLKALNLSFLGKWPEALAEFDALAPAQAAVLGEAHADALRTRSARVVAWTVLGRYEDVVNETDALSLDVERVLGPDDQCAASNARFRAVALEKLGWADKPAGHVGAAEFAPTPFSAIAGRRTAPGGKGREFALMGAAAASLALLAGGGVLTASWLSGRSASAPRPGPAAAASHANQQVAATSLDALDAQALRPGKTRASPAAGRPADAQARSQSMIVGRDGANVRAEPRIDAPLLVRLSAGSDLDVTGRTEKSDYDWFHVALPDSRSGFVREDVVVKPPEPLAVDAYAPPSPMAAGRHGAKVRTAPSTKAALVVRLDAGARLNVTGRTQAAGHSWYRIALPDRRSGFVRDDVVERASVSD